MGLAHTQITLITLFIVVFFQRKDITTLLLNPSIFQEVIDLFGKEYIAS
jgi:hypothetical protein